MADKIYLDNIVSGATIRDDKGKRISSTYTTQTDFQSYVSTTDTTLENIQNVLNNISINTIELTTEDLNNLTQDNKVYFARHGNTCTNIPYYGVQGLNFNLEVLKCGDTSTGTPSRIVQRLFCEGKTYTRFARGTTNYTWTNWTLLSKEGIQPIVTLPDITNDTGIDCTIYLNSCASVYKVKMTSTSSVLPRFIFNTQYIDFSAYVGFRDAYTFELLLTLEGTNDPQIVESSFSNVAWLDGYTPEISSDGNYLLVFRTFDLGNTWLGNLQGRWS